MREKHRPPTEPVYEHEDERRAFHCIRSACLFSQRERLPGSRGQQQPLLVQDLLHSLLRLRPTDNSSSLSLLSNSSIFPAVMKSLILVCVLVSMVSSSPSSQRPNSKFAFHYYELFRSPSVRGSKLWTPSTTTTTSTTTTAAPTTEAKETESLLPPGSCVSPSDCQDGECCAMGHTRFSLPHCVPVGGLGDTCIVNSRPRNRTIAFPNAERFMVSDVFTMFCACSPELECVQNTCQDPRLGFDNSISSADSEEIFA